METTGQGLPECLGIDTRCGGEPAAGKLSGSAWEWALQHPPPKPAPTPLKPKPAAFDWDWRDPTIGYGVVLPHDPAWSQQDLAAAKDAPAPIRDLIAAREAQVLRFRCGADYKPFLVRSDGACLPVSQSSPGVEPDQVPLYLLLVGTPEQIPWEVQFNLNAKRRVGRLFLQGAGLENYVNALLDDWKDAGARQRNTLVWATDHGDNDITSLMRLAIAEPIVEKLRADPDFNATVCYQNGRAGQATVAALTAALAELKPIFILTTSHGNTDPLDDVAAMRRSLGLPLDNTFAPVSPESLLEGWEPGGAVWYAHACCSAGASGRRFFDHLFEPGSKIERVLKAVEQCGEMTAPLPCALLGAKQPLRAFVGHVEPTFDWTLEQPDTKQYTTAPLTASLYERLFQPWPIGLAFDQFYRELGGIHSDYMAAMADNNVRAMLSLRLIARDIESTVILGDPTAVLPL